MNDTFLVLKTHIPDWDHSYLVSQKSCLDVLFLTESKEFVFSLEPGSLYACVELYFCLNDAPFRRVRCLLES